MSVIPNAPAPPPTPEVGLGEALHLLYAISEAILAGKAAVPATTLRIAGKHVRLGPCPIRVL